ncbi:MAG: hypothetical protein ACI97A_003343 [Planctomycetota bacterium]
MGPEIHEITTAMNKSFQVELLSKLQAKDLFELETIQELWSGYGTIKRYRVDDSHLGSIIIKHVCPPSAAKHPRGWNSKRSHIRKLKSYQVESAWYREWSHLCGSGCPVPKCYALESEGSEFYIALEDLDASGFSARLQSVSTPELKVCIKWLAHFHATFMGAQPKNLWEVGTYWHLDTRPDELEKVQDKLLQRSAKSIDQLLNNAQYQTIVHGDAKLANFCFAPDGKSVAAVDFQYVGGGCGMKDLAYLLGGCLSSKECAKLDESLLDYYFGVLTDALEDLQPDLDLGALESEWRALYAPAWADFHRFLKGWSPGHWKLDSYGEKLTNEVIKSLPKFD